MSFIAILLASLGGTHCTYRLIHRQKMDPIRATALVSLVYVGLSALSGNSSLVELQAVVFGSSFVAMSEPYRLNEKQVLLASFFFAVVYSMLKSINFFQFHGGVGGSLGGAAFVACLLVFWIQLGIDRVSRGQRWGR